jgi:hypothetical protein
VDLSAAAAVRLPSPSSPRQRQRVPCYGLPTAAIQPATGGKRFAVVVDVGFVFDNDCLRSSILAGFAAPNVNTQSDVSDNRTTVSSFKRSHYVCIFLFGVRVLFWLMVFQMICFAGDY